MTDWRQDIRQTDSGTVRYACGHGAKCKHTHNSTRFCDQCLADLPNLAQYHQMNDEVVTEVKAKDEEI